MTVAKSDARRVAEAENEARDAARRLRERSIALLEANQSLAQIPLLEFRLEESQRNCGHLAEDGGRLREENANLHEENARLGREIASLGEQTAVARADAADAWTRVQMMQRSKSWRLLAPLRRLRAALRR